MDNIIKSIFPQTCPHCHKDIMVAVQLASPVVSEILTTDDVEAAKEKVREAVNDQLSGKDKESALTWLDDENTVFGSNDVESIIASLKK